MSKKVAILQSNYIPWKGYFDLINMVDEFIFYDDVQYTKNDWRNRNIIKTISGPKWITIPVRQLCLDQKILETKTLNDAWRRKHWNMIKSNYVRAPFFDNFRDIFEDLYLNKKEVLLCQINYSFIKTINSILGIKTKLSSSVDYKLTDGKTKRLVDLCKQAGATENLSGPAAKNYIDENLFKEENIKLSWIDYAGYREYSQLNSPFIHEVSIIDLIFNHGENSKTYMKSFQTICI
jgi:hypothetical protein